MIGDARSVLIRGSGLDGFALFATRQQLIGLIERGGLIEQGAAGLVVVVGHFFSGLVAKLQGLLTVPIDELSVHSAPRQPVVGLSGLGRLVGVEDGDIQGQQFGKSGVQGRLRV